MRWRLCAWVWMNEPYHGRSESGHMLVSQSTRIAAGSGPGVGRMGRRRRTPPGAVAVDELAMPELEQQDGEQRLTGAAAARLLDQALDRRGREDAAAARAAVEERIADEAVAVGGEPARGGGA